MGSQKAIYSRSQKLPTNKILHHQSDVSCCQFIGKALAMRKTKLCADWNLETGGSTISVATIWYML